MCRAFMELTLLDADEFHFLAALILAHRAFCAAAIFLRAAADTLRFGFSTAAVLFADTPWPVSAPNNANTCCSLPISALTSLTIFSTLNVFPHCRQMRLDNIALSYTKPDARFCKVQSSFDPGVIRQFPACHFTLRPLVEKPRIGLLGANKLADGLRQITERVQRVGVLVCPVDSLLGHSSPVRTGQVDRHSPALTSQTFGDARLPPNSAGDFDLCSVREIHQVPSKLNFIRCSKSEVSYGFFFCVRRPISAIRWSLRFAREQIT